MKERSPRAGRPVHLPVLTEVVPMQETMPGALMVTPHSAPAADSAPGFDLPQPVPAWLLKTAPGDKAATPGPALPGFQGRIDASPAGTPASAFSSTSWWNTDGDPELIHSVSADLPAMGAAPAPAAPLRKGQDLQQLSRAVLAELEPELASKFEHCMREAMIPVMARAADLLMEELRRELSVQMREMVERAVARAITRQGGGG